MSGNTEGGGGGDPPNTLISAQYTLSVRTERPIEGCELVPTIFLSLKTISDARPRPMDLSQFMIRYVWKRGPQKLACLNPSCVRLHSFEPTQWSKAALRGPELVCNVCTQTLGVSVQDASFCSRSCFTSAWKEHSRCHLTATQAEKKEVDEEDENLTTTNGAGTNGGDNFSAADWTVISQDKNYIPVAADIGRRLVLQVTVQPLDAPEDAPYIVGPVVYLTDIVLRSPTKPPKRPLHPVPGASAGVSSSVRFRIVSYNILSEIYATKSAYPNCDMWNLSWPYRRKMIFEELEEAQGDIVCLQEVQADYFESDLQPFMTELGYDGVFKAKSRGSTHFAKIDGCATFWKRHKFAMTQKFGIEFSELARQEATELGLDDFNARKFMNRLNRENIAQILVLESLMRPTGAAAGRGVSFRPPQLCVVNTHLYSNQQRADVKLWQAARLLREVQGFVLSRDIPLVVCGDFNSEPSSAVYDLLTNRRLTHDHPEMDPSLSDGVRILPDPSVLGHSLDLASAMATALGSEPSFTNYTAKFKGTLDYIFYSPGRVRLMAVATLPEEETLRESCGEGLPSANYPSDHLMLCCDMAILSTAVGGLSGMGGNGYGLMDHSLKMGNSNRGRK